MSGTGGGCRDEDLGNGQVHKELWKLQEHVAKQRQRQADVGTDTSQHSPSTVDSMEEDIKQRTLTHRNRTVDAAYMDVLLHTPSGSRDEKERSGGA